MSALDARGTDQATRLRSLIGDRGPRTRQPKTVRELRPPTIVVASGKGGVGKTVLSVSMAAVLSRRFSVALVDADFGAANADVMLGLAPLRRLDESFVQRFAPGHRPIDLAIEAADRLWLVPGVIGARYRPTRGEQRQLVESLDDFEGVHGAVIIDAPAGVDQAVTGLLSAADCPVIVTTCEPTAMADAYALLKSLHADHGNDAVLGTTLIVNCTDSDAAARRVASRIAAVSERFLGCRPVLAGIVPWDRRVRQGVRTQRPAALARRASPAVRAVEPIALSIWKRAADAQEVRIRSGQPDTPSTFGR